MTIRTIDEAQGGEHDSCKIPGSPSERAETRRAISLVAR
jgi:hypothetical protein